METIFIEQNVMQEAWIWFVPIIASVLIGGTLIVGLSSSDIGKNFKGVGMAVLGMQESGKTTWYNYLLGENREGQTTEYIIRQFSISLGDGDDNKLTIREGKDIGGVEEYQKYYEEMVKTNDKILFLFNLNNYDTKWNYQRQVHSRIQLICEAMGKDKVSENLYIIMTHADKVKNLEKTKANTKMNIQDKEYGKKIKFFEAVNMVLKKDCNQLKTKIFSR